MADTENKQLPAYASYYGNMFLSSNVSCKLKLLQLKKFNT